VTPLQRLQEAAAAAFDLGLIDRAKSARELVERTERRLGFPGQVYVLALAGGTGVGKSSVLNALAEEPVSPARALRPTTEQPLAWVADQARQELSPLFDWLGVERVVGHHRDDLAGVAILDLPDVDSVRIEHRAIVDALLPRIDAVAWVVDPEKYDDERLHAYLRRLAPHAERMRFIFNKSDRLDPREQRMLVDDFRRRLEGDGIEQPLIDMVSAADGTGFDDLRADLDRAADAKAIVAAKLATDAATEVDNIAREAGLEPGTAHSPLLSITERNAAIATTVEGAMALVDPVGAARQMQEAVLHQARRHGGSLLARILALLSFITGRKRRQADPAAYLVDWARRGSLGHVLNPVRSALVKAAGGVPATTRPAMLRALGADAAETAITRSLDRSTRQAASELTVPSSTLWPIVGFLQLLSGAVLLFAIAWYLTVIFGPGSLPVATVDVPYVGPVPTPLVLIAGSLALSLFLGFVLTLHASWIGRRMGARAMTRVAEAVSESIKAVGFGGLDAVEDARRRLAEAANRNAVTRRGSGDDRYEPQP
jgi:GTP-binding protein EngB required for normal cell division